MNWLVLKLSKTKSGKFLMIFSFFDWLSSFVFFPTVQNDGPMFENAVDYSETHSLAYYFLQSITGKGLIESLAFYLHLAYAPVGLAGFMFVFLIIKDSSSLSIMQKNLSKG